MKNYIILQQTSHLYDLLVLFILRQENKNKNFVRSKVESIRIRDRTVNLCTSSY